MPKKKETKVIDPVTLGEVPPEQAKSGDLVVDDQPGVEDGLLADLLTEEEIRQQMNAVLRRMPTQQERLTKAFEARAKMYARTWLAICLMDETYLHNDEAKAMMLALKVQIADKKHKPLTTQDKHALITLDLGDLQLEYDLAELIVKADQDHYRRLNSQLIWYMSNKKFTGDPEKLGYEKGKGGPRATDMIYKNLDVPIDPENSEQLATYKREEIAEMIESGDLDPTPEAVDYAYNAGSDDRSQEDPAGTDPFETKVDELKDSEGVPIHEPEHFTPEEVEAEPQWLEDLTDEQAAAAPLDPNDPKTPVLPPTGKTIGSIYDRPTYTEFLLERDGKLPEELKKPTPVADAIKRIGEEEVQKNLKEIMEDPEALRRADDEVFGPRDDENDPNYVEPTSNLDWLKSL